MRAYDNNDLPSAFITAWPIAAEHLQSQLAPGTFQWARNYRFNPLIEHFSFWLDNQFFFVFVELPGEMPFAGEAAEKFLETAVTAKATPCLLPMIQQGETWVVRESGWGLIDARTGAQIDPPSMVTEERIEMSEYEYHAMAVGMVLSQLSDAGKTIVSCQPYPNTDPSIFFSDDEGFAWISIKVGIYPDWPSEPPKNLMFLARSLAMQEWPRGYYAPVGLCSQEQDVTSEETHPLWRVPGLKGAVGDLQMIPQRLPKHEVRARDSVLFDKVLHLFHQFDPGKLLMANNPDEYDAETATTIERLPEADSLEEFIVILQEEMEFWFSCWPFKPEQQLKELAEQIWTTWLIHQSLKDQLSWITNYDTICRRCHLGYRHAFGGEQNPESVRKYHKQSITH